MTAVAMKCLGGRILARLHPTTDEQRERTIAAGFDPARVLDTTTWSAATTACSCATGITDGDLLPGVRYLPGGGADAYGRSRS